MDKEFSVRKVADYIDGCMVEIYERPVKNEEKTEKEGIAIFDNVPYVRIKAANSRDVFDQPLNKDRRQRYPKLVDAFEKGENVALSGTPVEEWSFLDVAQVESLKSAGIMTVQGLAEMSESGLHRLPAGYITLKQKAQEWLSSGDKDREEIKSLQTQVADLLEAVEELKTNQKKAPGRPRKEAA